MNIRKNLMLHEKRNDDIDEESFNILIQDEDENIPHYGTFSSTVQSKLTSEKYDNSSFSISISDNQIIKPDYITPLAKDIKYYYLLGYVDMVSAVNLGLCSKLLYKELSIYVGGKERLGNIISVSLTFESIMQCSAMLELIENNVQADMAHSNEVENSRRTKKSMLARITATIASAIPASVVFSVNSFYIKSSNILYNNIQTLLSSLRNNASVLVDTYLASCREFPAFYHDKNELIDDCSQNRSLALSPSEEYKDGRIIWSGNGCGLFERLYACSNLLCDEFSAICTSLYNAACAENSFKPYDPTSYYIGNAVAALGSMMIAAIIYRNRQKITTYFGRTVTEEDVLNKAIKEIIPIDQASQKIIEQLEKAEVTSETSIHVVKELLESHLQSLQAQEEKIIDHSSLKHICNPKPRNRLDSMPISYFFNKSKSPKQNISQPLNLTTSVLRGHTLKNDALTKRI